MHLSRLHLANIGYKDAWFDGVTLDFREPDNALASDTIVHLINGGGKGCLIGFLFTVMEPSHHEFLPHLADKNRSLFDYLVPMQLAVIVSEWQSSSANGDKTTWVIAQALHWDPKRPGPRTEQLRRWFFGFESSPYLNFETLPVKGIGRPLEEQGALERWFKVQQRQAPPGLKFLSETTQKKWSELLFSIGFDPYLFRTQIQMNKQESGASELLKFHNLSDFLYFFFRSVLPEERVSPTYENIREFYKKHDALPATEKQVEVILSIQNKLEEMRPHVLNREVMGKRITTSVSQLMSADSAFTIRLDSLSVQAKKTEASLTAELRNHREVQQQLSKLKRENEQLRALQLHYDIELLEKKLSCSLSKRNRLLTCEKLLQAGELWADIQFQSESIAEHHGAQSTPLLNIAMQLNRRLTFEILQLSQKHESLQSKGETYLEEQYSLDAELSKLNRDIALVAGDIERDQQQMEKLGNIYLEHSGLFSSSDENIDERLSRLQNENQSTIELINEIISRQKQLNSSTKTSLQESANTKVKIRHARFKLRRYAVNSRRRVQEKNALSQHPTAERLFESLDIDIEKLEMDGLLQQRLMQIRQNYANSLLKQRELEQEIAVLEQSRLFPINNTLVEASKILKKADIPHQWHLKALAERGAEAVTLEEIIHKSPFLRTGFIFQHKDDLEKAREILAVESLILSPVALSMPVPDDIPAEFYSVGHIPPQCYDFQAAEEYCAKRRHSLTKIERQLENLESLESELLEYKINRWLFLKQFPPTSRINALQKATTLSQYEQQLQEHRLLTEGQITQLEQSLEAEFDALLTIPERLSAQMRSYHTLVDLSGQFPKSLTEYQEDVEHSKQQLQTLKKRKQSLEHSLNNVKTKINDNLELLLQYNTKLDELKALQARVTFTQREAPTVGKVSAKILFQRYESLSQNQNDPQQHAVENYKLRCSKTQFNETFSPNIQNAAKRLKIRSNSKLHLQQILQKITCAEKEIQTFQQEIHTQKTQLLRTFPKENLKQFFQSEKELQARLKENESECKRHIQSDRQHQKTQKVLRELCQDIQQKLNKTETLRIRINEQLAWPMLAPFISADGHFAPIEITAEQVGSMIKQLQQQLGDYIQATDEVTRSIDSIRKQIRSKEISHLLPSLSKLFDTLDVGELVANVVHIENELQERLSALKSSLEHYKNEKNTAVELLSNLVADANHILNQVAVSSAIRLPGMPGTKASEPIPILNVTIPKTLLKPKPRTERITRFLEEMLISRNLPQTPYQLLIDILVDSEDMYPYVVELLKPRKDLEIEYTPVEKIAYSGGERLTGAMLLYCLVADARKQQIFSSPSGGVLIQDNPFASANHEPFIALQMQIARHRNIQLVYFTGSHDWDAMSDFPHWVKLRNCRKDKHSGFSVITREDQINATLSSA